MNHHVLTSRRCHFEQVRQGNKLFEIRYDEDHRFQKGMELNLAICAFLPYSGLMEQRLVKIGEAARILGTTPGTLRKWEASGEIIPARKSKGGTRYYAVEDLVGLNSSALLAECSPTA